MQVQSNPAQIAPRFFVPEAVQTSAMDCGPAALKSLLEGFGIPASYGRLREACQTDVDGTSINTLEDVAQRLGLQAEQMMAPPDHLLLSTAQLLPALVVTVLPNGFNHFVVVWRTHGHIVQLMDPATGRRWSTQRRFLDEIYRYTVPFSAEEWRAWAETAGFVAPLHQRLTDLQLPTTTLEQLIATARADESWRSFAALDATTRMVTSIVHAKGITHGQEATELVAEFFHQTQQVDTTAHEIIPDVFWTVRPLPATTSDSSAADQRLLMQGAVLLKVAGLRTDVSQPPTTHEWSMLNSRTVTEAVDGHLHTFEQEDVDTKEMGGRGSILTAALAEAARRPEWEILQTLRPDGLLKPSLLISAALLAALSVTAEAAILRGLMVMATDAQLGVWRLTLSGGLVAFVLLLLVLEFLIATAALRMGRRLEAKIRIAFLEKIPRLGDRYFHSRLISDMAQRAYGLHQLHALPDLALRFLRLCGQLFFTTVGIIWLYPAAAPIALLAMVSAVAGALLTHPLQSERDMRVRTHTGALSRFYLDALMGLLPIRTHSAERTMRQEQEMLLAVWARESLALARIEALSQSLAALIGIGFAIWIVFSYIAGRGEAGTLLLLLYWSLNLPALGQSLALSARQYPAIRNNLARILEPLGAPEEESAKQAAGEARGQGDEESAATGGVGLSLEHVTVQAGGHVILEDVNLVIEAGEHVAIVGESGAGKSTLVGLLLGWHQPASGRILVDDELLAAEHMFRLRRWTAWVDPAVQLWNRSLQENLRYGNGSNDSTDGEPPIGLALKGAELYDVLERLPNGLQTRLGEGGGLVSGGEGQRVRLGRALLRRDVRLAILDEPFRGLDRAKRRQLLGNVQTHWQDATLLCITHDIGETVNFARVLVVKDGRIVEDGDPQTLLTQPTSSYRQLLHADEAVRRRQWATTAWRRLWLANGNLRTHTEGGSPSNPTVMRELQQIKGIGPAWAERLHAVGIHTIADLATADVAQLNMALMVNGRKPSINLEAWIERAQLLAQGDAQ